MEFQNEGLPIKIRIGKPSDCYWQTINKGQKIDLPADVGKRYGFKVKTTEGQLNGQIVETKQIDTSAQINTDKNTDKNTDDLFFNELIAINGIGRKTAEDIVVWKTKEKLIEQIKLGNSLPFHDDIEEKLRLKYG